MYIILYTHIYINKKADEVRKIGRGNGCLVLVEAAIPSSDGGQDS